MAYKAGILIGRIIKVHGFDGSVIIKPEGIFVKNITEKESVFLEVEGKPVPFFISESEDSGGGLIKMKFRGYESAGKMNEFSGCRVFLASRAVKNRNLQGSDLSGFRIQLTDKSVIGTVCNVIETPGNNLLIVKTSKGRELLIPLHADFIVSSDKRKKILVMDLPDGLTDLN